MSGSIARTIARPVGRAVGLPLTLDAGGGVPAGYSLVTYEGVQVTYDGKRVLTDGYTLFVEN